MSFSAVILAGGKSSRMGLDKAWLKVGGQTLLARQIDLACETGAEEILISGRADVDYSAFGRRVVNDKFPDAGPLAGIESALDSISTPLVLALAVDLPEMNAVFLRQLLSRCRQEMGVIPRVAGYIEPLASFYPKIAKPLAEAMLRKGKNAVHHFAESCVRSNIARFVEYGADGRKYFTNWNSPDDLDIAR